MPGGRERARMQGGRPDIGPPPPPPAPYSSSLRPSELRQLGNSPGNPGRAYCQLEVSEAAAAGGRPASEPRPAARQLSSRPAKPSPFTHLVRPSKDGIFIYFGLL